ncbi:hypothetical protein [Alishewanella longhuensis]
MPSYTATLGDVADGLHTGRSRGDLVATDLRLWPRSNAALQVTPVVVGGH